MTAATLVGLMSIPGLAVLYGGLVQKKWAVNTMMMVFCTFCLVLITWALWAYKMGFGAPWIGGSLHLLGKPGASLGTGALEGQGNIPLLSAGMPHFRIPQSSVFYFQFVFAAITPILFIGSVLGRINFKVWLIFVPLWITFAYAVNAFLLWGGGFWAGKGALDFSGGYVIHLAAGGAGILWLGWNGFNGGDPYFAGSDAAAAIVNTNLCTAIAMMTWIVMDMIGGPEKKPTFLGGLNGMICGLVGITPAAGYVNGFGAIIIGLVCSAIVWFAWNYLSKVPPFNKVDDALGVVYTHGIAGLFGGLLVGLLADPKMIVYLGIGKNPVNISGSGLFYGHAHQLLVQLGAAATIIVWDGLVTFLLLKGIGLFMKLRMNDEELEIGDVAIHGEEAYPSEGLALSGVGAARAAELSAQNKVSVKEEASPPSGT
jgi:Amt family ammonium transporter